MTDDGWRSRVRGVVTDRDGRVLALPELDLDGVAEQQLEDVRDAFGRLLGARVAILRALSRSLHRDERRLDLVYALEALEPVSEPPPGTAWLDRATLGGELAALVGEPHVPASRAPWAREGWLAEATAWIESSLTRLGRPPAGPVEQVRTWPLSAVLRVPTDRGLVYFKATSASPLFVDEGRVMEGLARLFPREVPGPLAVESERRWMLLDDVGPSIGWKAPSSEREAVLALFARIQVASSRDVDALLAMGCVDRRGSWLARETSELLRDDVSVSGLEEEERARLRSLERLLVELCSRLANGPVPDALVHGDLHLDNVARAGGDYVFFDWSDACVTHPFLDLIDVHREEDPVVREQLRDAYLEQWTEVAPRARLLELWEIARPLSCLNQAVSYRHIMASVEPGSAPNLEWALPHWLRNVLETDFDSLP